MVLSGLTQLNPHQETSARHLISPSAVLQHGLEPFLPSDSWRLPGQLSRTHRDARTDPPSPKLFLGLLKSNSQGNHTQSRLAVLSSCVSQTRINSLAGFKPLISKLSSLCLSTKECYWAPPASSTENNSHHRHLLLETKPYIGSRLQKASLNSTSHHLVRLLKTTFSQMPLSYLRVQGTGDL